MFYEVDILVGDIALIHLCTILLDVGINPAQQKEIVACLLTGIHRAASSCQLVLEAPFQKNVNPIRLVL
jgi:hypothetical protein